MIASAVSYLDLWPRLLNKTIAAMRPIAATTPITMATIAPIDRPAFRSAESGAAVDFDVDATEVELLRPVDVDVSMVELLRLVAVEEDEVASTVPGYMVVE
jgi:hypothetical protein